MSRDPFDDDIDVDAAWAVIVSNWDASDHGADDLPDAEAGGLAGSAPAAPAPTRPGSPSADTRMSGAVSADELHADELHPGDKPAPAADHRATNSAASQAGPTPRPVTSRIGPRDIDPAGPSLLDGLDGDEDEGYLPPEPPPLPRPKLISALAWLGAIGGPAFLMFAALFWRTVPALWIGAAALGFVAGFITLIVRLPDRDEDADDGAVV